MKKLKVIVADDSSLYRDVLSKAVNGTGMAEVKFVASNGRMVVDFLKKESVDLVLLDVFMPEMDGIEALKIIKKNYPNIDVIMISSDSMRSAELTVEALDNGAIDFILKPADSDHEKSAEIIKAQLQILFMQVRLKNFKNIIDNNQKEIKRRNNSKKDEQKIETDALNKFDLKKFTSIDLILIASSTGGPSALEKIFTGLDSDFNIPILVVQHMPPKFTRSLSESLNKKCKISVKEGCNNDLVQKGQIIIAPGGYHMLVEREGPNLIIKTEATPYVNGVRPAADVLFSSVANKYEDKNILAVILTGMGSDGKNGVMMLKQKCNCYCITQSENTCVVYGMPKSVYQSGLSDEVVDIDDISKRIQEIATGKGILPS
ncbi:chemotaxis-specific protein-glutamate methyltransferase CheB [Acetivibrio clariflavus]|uniref:Protein-glutamate methylesterase/protein-glutamine glutaminase n=1 Tax=Acetivibrio clariflavus (strain DSM 19732 / NBRC 101661 / EBR45) TaxID=720554 RepID=G8LYS7_ACECE|nr:chemotaxis-specific protein-glutamate methyltransferase CheB [Acetivibrio clariflavus]AEV66795.1 chemotaxis response regulator containing a CheY-like receiver domain and a methylesterase domain [Acetivibrio clariflavus DSM 19732]